MKPKLAINIIFLSLTTMSFSVAMSGGECAPEAIREASSRKLTFKDRCEIEINLNGEITIFNGGEALTFNDKDKPTFDSKTGEVVIEYSSPGVDNNEQRSWAKAVLAPNSHSPKHFHKERTEDYYIISPNAKARVVVDGMVHDLSTGDHLRIFPEQAHQVTNRSEEELSLIVKCSPSWIPNDHNLL